MQFRSVLFKYYRLIVLRRNRRVVIRIQIREEEEEEENLFDISQRNSSNSENENFCLEEISLFRETNFLRRCEINKSSKKASSILLHSILKRRITELKNDPEEETSSYAQESQSKSQEKIVSRPEEASASRVSSKRAP